MSMHYGEIEDERKTGLITDLLSEWEDRMANRVKDGEEPDCPDWQDLVNACREYMEIAHMNATPWEQGDERKED